MVPVLRPGDRCWVRWGAAAEVGQVVVARRPDRPDLLIVKRLVRRESDGAWLEGDNPDGSHDSWVFGPVAESDLLGRVVARLWPPPFRLAER